MAAVPVPRTLDLKEPQILRHYPNDPNGFYWHHRLLLVKVSPGIFIGATPDGDIERIDLHQTDHVALERRSDFPPPQAPYVYAFDDLERGELEQLRRRARNMATLFNEVQLDDIEAYEWMIGDLSHPNFGETVPEDAIAAGVSLGDLAIVELEGTEVMARRVATSEKADIILKMDASRGDTRLLGLFKDPQGKRFIDFKTAMTHLKENEQDDWFLQGPRVLMELFRAIRSGPGDLATYHLTWVKNSGVSPYSMVAHDHRIICNVLRAAIEVDQYNVADSLAFEILSRRLVQIETAVGRNAQSPDFTGLELILEDPVGAGGEATTSVFNTWLATKLKEKANVAKQTRLYREEFKGSGSEDRPKGKYKGDGKDRPRPKPKPKGKGNNPGQPAGGAGAVE